MPDEKPEGEVETSDELRQTTASEGRENYCTSEDCRWLAWRLHAEGNFAFYALARAVNSRQHSDHPRCPDGPHNDHWARRAVDECGAAVAEAIDRGGPVALAQYLQGLQSDLQHQLSIATQGTAAIKVRKGKDTEEVIQVPDNFLRSLARTRVTAIREQMAAGLRVVTKREGRENTGGIDVNLIGKLQPETCERIARDLSADGNAGSADDD